MGKIDTEALILTLLELNLKLSYISTIANKFVYRLNGLVVCTQLFVFNEAIEVVNLMVQKVHPFKMPLYIAYVSPVNKNTIVYFSFEVM